jgi:hypothetical protein
MPQSWESLEILSSTPHCAPPQPDKDGRQEIGIWEWAEENKEDPVHLEHIPSRHLQTAVRWVPAGHTLMTTRASGAIQSHFGTRGAKGPVGEAGGVGPSSYPLRVPADSTRAT